MHMTLQPVCACTDAVQDQTGPGFEPAPVQAPCGVLDATPCTKPLVQPCKCSLYLDPDSGLCKSEISSGALCPQRPYCGYDRGPPCAFPYESPCDECNEVDGAAGICVRDLTCTRGMLPILIHKSCTAISATSQSVCGVKTVTHCCGACSGYRRGSECKMWTQRSAPMPDPTLLQRASCPD